MYMHKYIYILNIERENVCVTPFMFESITASVSQIEEMNRNDIGLQQHQDIRAPKGRPSCPRAPSSHTMQRPPEHPPDG